MARREREGLMIAKGMLVQIEGWLFIHGNAMDLKTTATLRGVLEENRSKELLAWSYFQQATRSMLYRNTQPSSFVIKRSYGS